MSKKRTHAKWISVLLLLAMIVGLLPTAVVYAADDTGTGSLVLDKTATLADDGTYTISLEAYATGSQAPTPADIVLVLDVSGSMNVPDYPTDEAPTPKLYTSYCSDAYNMYVDGKATFYHNHTDRYYESGYDDGYDRTDGVVYNSYYRRDYPMTVEMEYTESTDTYTYTFKCPLCGNSAEMTKSPTSESTFNESANIYAYTNCITRMEALKNAASTFIDEVRTKNATTDTEHQHRIAIVKFAGNEYEITGNHFWINSSTQQRTNNCSQIVKELTLATSDENDGLTTALNALTPLGATQADKGLSRAIAALEGSDSTREKIVVFITDGYPTSALDFDGQVAANAVNYAHTLETTYGATVFAISVMEEANNTSAPTTDMDKFMHAVSSNYPNATATGTSDTFTVTWGDPNASSENYYKKATEQSELDSVFADIGKEVGSTIDLDANAVLKDALNDGFVITDTTNVTVQTANYQGSGDWADPVSFGAAGITLDQENNTVSVNGFSYKDNYVSESPVKGKKLIVTITGVEATDDAITNGYVYTNAPASGIYENSKVAEALAVFPHPTVMLTSKTYVMDYAGSVSLSASDWQQSAITHIDGTGMHQFGTANTSADMTYGFVEKESSTSLTYTPQTMKWDGYDSFYVFGKNADDTENLWSKVSVLPANNVYYEDTYVTSDGQGSGARVGIEYTGNWTEIKSGSEDNSLTTVDNSGGKSSVFERVTSVDDITDGDYVLIVKNGTGTYSGEYDYYALTNNQLTNNWMQAMSADGYMDGTISDSIRVEDDSIIWSLSKGDGTFTLTDSTGKALYHNGNELNVSKVGSAWTASNAGTSGTFYLQDMSDSGRYLVLRDDSTAGSADDYGQPKFRCKGGKTVTSDSCFEFILYRRKSANTEGVTEVTTNYQLVTNAADITSGKYVLIAQVGKGKKYTGECDYFAIKKQQSSDNSPWVLSAIADDYMNGSIPNTITVTDDTIIWTLDATDGTFTLTDGAGTALYHSGNNLGYQSGTTATAWTATKTGTEDSVVTFYLEDKSIEDSKPGRYLALRDDQAVASDNSLPRFRCTANNTTASASCYQFYLYRQVTTTTTVSEAVDDSNSVHGWEESYGDDTTISNGTAHGATSASAQATFTFSGTGVDIYGRTTPTSGQIFAQIKRADGEPLEGEGDDAVLTKNILVDERSFSGTYYQIPTLSFSGLEHSSYTVTLIVTSNPAENATEDERFIYYLDGIRVYNPLSSTVQNTDQTVKDAYGDELNATFQEVRDILIDAESFGSDSTGDETVAGAVFLDRVGTVENGNSDETYDVGDYEDFGPKNEVYLAKDQAIVFKVVKNADDHFYIGLKAPDSTKPAVKVCVTDGTDKKELTIQGASDMYYEVVPSSEGYIMIQNASESDTLLSITKLRVTDPEGNDPKDTGSEESSSESIESANNVIQEDSLTNLVAYANTFSTLSVSDTATEPEPVEPDPVEPAPSDPEPNEPEPTEPGLGDVEIENPDPEEPEPSHVPSQFLKMLQSFIDNFGSWFPFPRRNP